MQPSSLASQASVKHAVAHSTLTASAQCTASALLQAGQIVDDDLCAILVNPLGPGVRLHAIIDACHSGSMLDLEESAQFKNGTAHWKQGAPCLSGG